jgi:hypothetical protein
MNWKSEVPSLKLRNKMTDNINSRTAMDKEYTFIKLELSFLKKRMGIERIIGKNISRESKFFIYSITLFG